ELSRFELALLKIGVLPFVARIGARRELEAGLREHRFTVEEFMALLNGLEVVETHTRPLLTGGIPSAPRWLESLVQRLTKSPADFLTRWFGGEIAGFAKAGKAAAAFENQRLIVARDAEHDLVGLESQPAPDEITIMGHRAEPVERKGRLAWFIIPKQLKEHRFLAIDTGDAKPVRVAIDSRTTSGRFYQYSFYENPASPACPDCVYVRDFCEPSLCSRHCESACPKGALRFGDVVEIDRTLCNGCGDCLLACPFEALDRPILKETDSGFICELCGKIFKKVNGVALLLDSETERLIGQRK
ncbi:MAG TPA: hypothetical protein ENF73_03765, partial [Proteobacteria bacterium]|nr:hypothetical protein [Pseudomonadota bacterium]